MLRGFEHYCARYLARHFHALRLLGGWPEVPAHRPLVVYLNHPSWWDPLICLALAPPLQRENFAPIDAAMGQRYGFMKWLGFFPVEQGTRRGAATFLRAGEAILGRPGTSLWVTPQGRFADARERPVRFAAGLEHLARRVPQAVFLPLALEFPFWTERTPEALAHFGAPASPGALASQLESAMETLAAAALRREPAEFTTVLRGRAGEGGLHETWRRWRARWRGEHFQRAHGREEP